MRISGGGNFLSPRNEGLENGTAKPCHPEERSDVRIASSSKAAFTSPSRANLRTDVSPDSENMERAGHKPESDTVRAWSKFKTGMSEAKGEQESTETLNFRCDCERCRLTRGRKYSQANKVAFTLAEVLITLGIIGIVAAMTLPTLNQAINNRVRAEQVRTVKYKFTKATEKMNSLGLIGPYASTDAFVDELQKHLKIMKRCDSSHLRECWPYDEVDLGDGKTWDISKTTTGKQLKMKDGDSADYSSNNVGIVTADGTPMILSYNKKCEALDPVKQYTWSTSDGKPVSNATAGCVAAVFEINGGAKPNKFGTDVVAFNASGLGSSCAFEVNGTCYTAPFTPKPLTEAECEAQKSALGIKECCPWCRNRDYWAGAVKACKDQGKKLPTMAQLAELASQMYVGNPSIGAINDESYIEFDPNSSVSKALGLKPSFALWSGNEYRSEKAYSRYFGTTFTQALWTNVYRNDSSRQAVCLGD